MTYLSTWMAVAAMALVAGLILGGMAIASWILRPRVPEQGKSAVYESGEVPTGTTRTRFNIQYYMVALLFLVFDVETAFIVPWVLIYRQAVPEVGLAHALVPMLVFIGTLLAALLWAWRIGAIQWSRRQLHTAPANRGAGHE